MIVHEICTRQVVTIAPDATVRAAARLMRERSIGGLVVAKAGRPVGILTERDLVHRLVADDLDADTTSVAAIMSSPIITVAADAQVDEAARLMRERRVKRLVAMRGDDVWGIVTVTDIAHARPDITREFLETWVKPRWQD